MAITSATAIEKLVLARDVLQEQIDAWVAARDAQKALMNSSFAQATADASCAFAVKSEGGQVVGERGLK